ncbi:MAG: hypothetical protein IJ938_03520 [Clostridia bacterium]|nr:hypothetical protein [Clostridia bacterium]
MVNKKDFINAIDKNIDMIRGDTLAFNFELAGLGSLAAYDALDVLLAVAEHYDDEALIEITKTDGIALEEYNEATDTALFSVCIAPNHTKNMDLERYYYDLQIKDTNNVITLMRGRLTLLWDVAD